MPGGILFRIQMQMQCLLKMDRQDSAWILASVKGLPNLFSSEAVLGLIYPIAGTGVSSVFKASRSEDLIQNAAVVTRPVDSTGC
jgi:hypothetical protein